MKRSKNKTHFIPQRSIYRNIIWQQLSFNFSVVLLGKPHTHTQTHAGLWDIQQKHFMVWFLVILETAVFDWRHARSWMYRLISSKKCPKTESFCSFFHFPPLMSFLRETDLQRILRFHIFSFKKRLPGINFLALIIANILDPASPKRDGFPTEN